MLLSKTLRLFLDGIGRREEYEYYLKSFQAEEGRCFAALAPDLASMEQSAELMVFDLQFLLRLELAPLLLLCGKDASAMAQYLVDYADTVLLQRVAGLDEMAPRAQGAIAQARSDGKVAALVVPGAALGDVACHLMPALFQRLHLLRVQGGLRDTAGELIWYHWLKGRNRQQPLPDEAPLLALAGQCLEAAPALHFSVASPLNLLQELFTVRGAGTILRPGSDIVRAATADAVDVPRLQALLEESFRRPLVREGFLHDVSDFYIEKTYRGAALLEPHPAGKYLSKFAVGMRARGEGLALELWSAISADHPALFWRSRRGNPINTWYGRQADGRQLLGDWHIYWRGVAPADLPAIMAYTTGRPEDFGPAAADPG